MKLDAYLLGQRGRAARVARELRTSTTFVSQMATGVRPIAVRKAAQLERACEFQVRRWDMFPDDWHEVWPELVGADGAPPVPNTEQEIRHAV